MSGYMAQFSEFAWFAYLELVDNRLEWICLADPDVPKLDDIQYASTTQVHAYQVKWTIAAKTISFGDFKKLLPGLVLSWQSLRAKYQGQHKQTFGHLLTNKELSTKDKITNRGVQIGSFADFFNDVWLKLKAHQPHDPKWNFAVKKLLTLSGLDAAGFADFVDHFDFQPAHVAKDFSITRAGYRQLDDDLARFRSYILEKVGDASRPVELKANHIIADLGWDARFKTTFNHELFVDPQKYQPIVATLQALNAKLTEHKGGYLFLAGAPGTGKSTLLTQWAKDRPEQVIKYYAFDFSNPASPGNYHERGDSTTLFFDLVFQLKAAGVYDTNILPYKDLHYLREVFYRQLRLLGDEFGRSGRKTILLIDGLDHVPREYRQVAKSFLRDLPLPASLPAGVYLLLGSQTYELEDLSQEIKAEWRRNDRKLVIESLDRHAVFHLAEASDLQPPLTADQKLVLFEKSKGHPLYLSYLLERLRNSTDWDATLNEFTLIEGDITTYYRKIWEPIASDFDLVTLLGLAARINGPIDLSFIREWNFEPSVLEALRLKAKPLFVTTLDSWSFFHNSFRQFLFQQTALDPLTGEYSAAAEADLHRQLADYYQHSKEEQRRWHAIFHLYHAGETARFLQSATPANFVDHLLKFRPAEEIKRDLRLGLELAGRTRDVVALTRYALAFAELESRLRHVSPASFVREFLHMKRPDLARRCLRTGNTLHTNPAYALIAARRFYDADDRPEAAMLFTLAEPATVKAAAIVIDEALRFEEVQDVLAEWVTVAIHFQSLPSVLTRLNTIQLTGPKKHRSTHQNEVTLRLTLLQRLALRLIALGDWDRLDAVLADFRFPDERRTKVFFEVVQAAVTGCLAGNNRAQATLYLELMLQEFALDTLKGTPRIYVADLIYQVTGDIPLVRTWLAEVPMPTGMGERYSGPSTSLDEFKPFILLNKLLQLCGTGVPITLSAPAVPPGTDKELLVEFLRMIGLTTQLLADGVAGVGEYADIVKRVRPIVRFYYRSPGMHHAYWGHLTPIQEAYFSFLISSVASLGGRSLQQLADFFLQEFAAAPHYWAAGTRRSILVALVEQGYPSASAKPPLLDLEKTMLDGKDADGRVTECRAQARAWLAVKDFAAAERLLSQALHEAGGIGYSDDYQLNTWLTWLQRVNSQQPAQAPDRLRWFLARLPHIRAITDGSSFLSASETLLETALAWNFSAGQQQLQWQLRKGLIEFDGALETFITGYLARITTVTEFGSILHFYTGIFLVHSPTLHDRMLTALLTRGYAILGKRLFSDYLPALIDSIYLRALEEKRRELLRALEQFVAAQGQAVTSFYPGFIVPPATRDEPSDGGNFLKLLPDHQQLSEAEVLTQVTTYQELLAMLAREDAGNSHFKWTKVLEQLAPSLSAAQLQVAADSMTNNRRSSLFYSTLSCLAGQLGARALAHQLADRAVQASGESGWVKGYDGGSRLRAFEALKRVEPDLAMQRAFDVFSHDLANAGNLGFYIEDLDNILPVLTEEFRVEMIWDEVFNYLQRLLANSQPLPDLPDLVPGTYSITAVLIDFTGYLARMPVPAVNRSARALLVTLAAQNKD